MKHLRVSMFTKGALAVLMAATVFSSCKKDDDDKNNNSGETSCKIIRITEPGEPDLVINYNKDGAIANISDGDYIKTFDYSGNTTTISKNVAGVLVEKSVIKLNSEGLATEVNTVFNANGNTWENLKFNYAGATLQSTFFEDHDENKDTAWYSWKNGNLQFIYTRTDTTELTYHTDETFRDGDYIKSSAKYLDGYETIRNVNLIKSATTKNNIRNYSYTYDAAHRITELTVVDPKTSTKQFVYDCK